jgi:hypothetical protein
MRYHIKIIKLEENKDYEEQLKEYRKRREYNSYPGNLEYPKKEIEVNTLDTILTEEEFIKIRNAVLGII